MKFRKQKTPTLTKEQMKSRKQKITKEQMKFRKQKTSRKQKIIILIISIIIILAVIISFTFGEKIIKQITGKSSSSLTTIEITPLNPEQREKVVQTLLSSSFIKDIPAKNPIALRFYTIENQQLIWQDGFLIANGELLSKGTPTIQLTVNSKYIEQFNGDNLCEIVNQAQQNGDLGFQSEYGKARLLIKYVSMLKYRECFGF